MKSVERVLLIEDDEDKAHIIKCILRKQWPDAMIRHIEDGEQALNYLFSDESAGTTLILLDLILPRVDGVEILRKIKSHPTKCQIPVMILTSSSQTQAYLDSLGLHPDGYFAKPGLKQVA